MTIALPQKLVEHTLLGPLTGGRRQMQDSPILVDVWTAFAREPNLPLDLLITPHKTCTASSVAVAVHNRINRAAKDDDPNISFLQGIVAARLYFDEVLRVVVPITAWWQDPRTRKELNAYLNPDEGPEKLSRTISAFLDVVKNWVAESQWREKGRFSALDRYVALAGLVLWARDCLPKPKRGKSSKSADELFVEAVKTARANTIADLLIELFGGIQLPRQGEALIFQVSRNRTASPALVRSVPAVKGDAARTLFNVNCTRITWAVLDSGIDRTHPAFRDAEGKCRVQKSLDFTQYRRIVSLGNAREPIRKKNLEEMYKTRKKLPENAEGILKDLADDAIKGLRVNWSMVEEMVVLKDDEQPLGDHGTHVAGIIGASKVGAEASAKIAGDRPSEDCADGMCPDINLYDFRVLAPTLQETEFAVIAALQYIRDLNERHRYITIHGANLSLSIQHDVQNYACGRTPVCLECEQMVESGIVVVAAAGNHGYQSFETTGGSSYEGYAALSVTDPGNADGVITVGATHRYSPYTYGVSFFSSRGPTGDGRPKPDLVAPGERIRGPLPGSQWGDLDGTSMAAPHVSGAAAMLMARYSELIGQPRRIKRILCDSATDLGRERSFQGHGMLDVLRAFQSV